jgi:hypothetical protein
MTPDQIFETEQVSENYQPRPGQMGTRTFWIAYPPWVASYGHMEDRISRALGTGDSKEEALAAAVRNTPPPEPEV